MMAGASGPEAETPREAMEAVEEHLAHLTPMRRAGTSEDIAQRVGFLASDASAFINGQDFVVDGGAIQGELWRDQASRLTRYQ
jgi:NAD(P)-dependent dehydrogenase (short-subunit alcohol dehydrogenase family)